MKIITLITLLTISLFLASCGSGLTGGITIGASDNMNRVATFETSQGTFKLKLYEDTMPITTKNFIDLAEKGFYDGTRFHRVIPNFMVQGGDPLSKNADQKAMWGTGGPGYKIKDEFTSENRNSRGTISMANAGPNTGGSQFFINVVNNNFLDGKHPVFGEVVDGMDVVDKIVKVPTSGPDRPVQDVVVNKVTVE